MTSVYVTQKNLEEELLEFLFFQQCFPLIKLLVSSNLILLVLLKNNILEFSPPKQPFLTIE